ncbi:hypothetical protein CVT24_011294 [Panaeolus cyanescens]|uniref:WAP domain-containing protein n=1 Tax=Panaeolus cyanescens TaxID=181874 RepID=A0A409YUU7_9AGAR|nr:hypothetical protein CVT24_011294 [Panaeolus cyanescens]
MFKLASSLVLLVTSIVTVQGLVTETLPAGAQCISYPAGISPIPCVSGTKCCWVFSRTDTAFCTPVGPSEECPTSYLTFGQACLDSNGDPLPARQTFDAALPDLNWDSPPMRPDFVMFKFTASFQLVAIGIAGVRGLVTETLPAGDRCLSYPSGYSPIPCATGTKCCLVFSRTDTGFCTPVGATGECPTSYLEFGDACLDSNGNPLPTQCESNLTCCVGTPALEFPSHEICTLKQYCI